MFTKWIELGVLRDLSSKTITNWLHENIICRYGVPMAIRCDRGSEFKGEFEQYLECAGIA